MHNMSMNEEDAFNFLVYALRHRASIDTSSYGYDVYIPKVIERYLDSEGIRDLQKEYEAKRDLSPHFFAAAWELCRRGVLRPGVRRLGAQPTDEGSGGAGYSLTFFGERWLAESEFDDYIPTEFGRFATLLEPFRSRFGAGFHQRAQEAIRCYRAHAFFGCCAMCGAATESIMLAAAVAKLGGEEALKIYSGAHGRGRIEARLVGQLTEPMQREFKAYTALLKYWRDESAHGMAVVVTDSEAFSSLVVLLRCATFANRHWDELTSR